MSFIGFTQERGTTFKDDPTLTNGAPWDYVIMELSSKFIQRQFKQVWIDEMMREIVARSTTAVPVAELLVASRHLRVQGLVPEDIGLMMTTFPEPIYTIADKVALGFPQEKIARADIINTRRGRAMVVAPANKDWDALKGYQSSDLGGQLIGAITPFFWEKLPVYYHQALADGGLADYSLPLPGLQFQASMQIMGRDAVDILSRHHQTFQVIKSMEEIPV